MSSDPSVVSEITDRRSIPSLIGWISLCALAAGWGPADTELRQTWSMIGVFGLVSAIGLDVGRRMQEVRARQKRRKQALKRFRSSVVNLAEQESNLRQIKAAVGEIVAVARSREIDPNDDYSRSRVAVHYPINIQPLSPLAARSGNGRNKTFAGELSNVSDNGIGVAHDLPIESKRIVAVCDVPAGPPLRLVVDLQWRNTPSTSPNHRYFSGGKIVRVESFCSQEEPSEVEDSEEVCLATS